MLRLYILMGFLNLIPIVYGLWKFKELSRPQQIFVLVTTVSFGVWFYSYILSTFKLGSTHSLHYVTPIISSILVGFFYQAALHTYRWSRFLVIVPLFALGYVLFDLYQNGQRKMAIDLMIFINIITVGLGLILLYYLLKQKTNLKQSSLFWLNLSLTAFACLGILSNVLLNRLFQYQNNEWFSMIYYGFWGIAGNVNTTLVTYSLVLDTRKLPGLDKIPVFEN